MRIFLYLDNQTYRNVDFSNPRNGNPGIGGTQFMIWSLSYYLDIFHTQNITILAHNITSLPANINKIKVVSINDAIYKAREKNSDIFIFRAINDKQVFDLIDDLRLTSIAWGHNFGDSKQLKYISNCEYLKRYVCVGKEQYDMLRDHKVYNKSLYIYNGLDFSNYNKFELEVKEKENIVCYIGSLIPAKGFHKLAKIWPNIEKRVPNAKLYVIGDGKLYNRDAILGSYGIADKKYENMFMHYLINENLEIKNNVKFFGSVGGEEKIRLLSAAKVGVVNPTGKTETFGIGAIELQSLGVPVVTVAKNGYFDTVKNGVTGILFKGRKEMENSIVELLIDNQKNEEMGKNARKFVNEKFNIKDICHQWNNLFIDILEDNPVELELEMRNKWNNLKWLRELNRNLKEKNMLFRKLPSVLDYVYLVKYLVNIFK